MEFFQHSLYVLAIVTSLACTVLLFRAYIGTRLRILMWAALCFVCLTTTNVLLFVDLVVLPTEIDLRVFRYGVALTGMLFMIYGFIFDAD